MKFDEWSMLEHYVVRNITGRFGDSVTIGIVGEDDENIDVARSAGCLTTGSRSEHIQLDEVVAVLRPGVFDERGCRFSMRASGSVSSAVSLLISLDKCPSPFWFSVCTR